MQAHLFAGVLGLSLITGCAARTPKADAAHERAALHAEQRAETQRIQGEKDAEVRAHHAAIKAQNAAERSSRIEAQRQDTPSFRTALVGSPPDCKQGREDRERLMLLHIDYHAKMGELRDWNNEHCKSVDNSKAVVRMTQDSRGEFHLIEGRDRGVEAVCDAPAPKGSRPPPDPGPVDLQINQCREYDLQASAVAAKYWHR